MMSVIIYRLFFYNGRHRGLYLLTMTAYYTVCFLVVSGPLATLGELGEESLHQPLPPVEEVMTSEVTAVSLRKRSVANRWTLRARVLERYCQEADVRVHRRGNHSTLVSEHHRLSSCAAGDTADRFWLRTFTRLAKSDPGHRCTERQDDVSRCQEEAGRLKALVDGEAAGAASDPQWTRVVTVGHPYARLAAAFLRQPFPAPSSSFSAAVTSLTSVSAGVPESARPLTSLCDLCSSWAGQTVILQMETEDEELHELGRQRGISDYLRRPVVSPHSPARGSATGPDPAAVSQLIAQLSPEQLLRLQRLYQEDFEAFSFYDPAEFGGSGGSSEEHHEV